MLSDEIIKELAPRAKQPYIDALSSREGWAALTRFGVSSALEPLVGFLGNVMHETGGLTIVRESLKYTTAQRLRTVWPSRFGNMSDAELKPFLNNERALAAKVYDGRMGNRPGTDDGFIFRGAGYLQTTGRDDFIKYGKLCELDFSAVPPPSTDDMKALLVMSAAEWSDGKCNDLCKAGRFDNACAVINVGNANKVGNVVELGERRKWKRRVEQVLQRYEGVLLPPSSLESIGGGPRRRRMTRSWWDPRRWLGSAEPPLEMPEVVERPELSDLGSANGNPAYVHFTEIYSAE
jgi:putative chitinase